MMHVLPCDRVREHLEAFVDGELTLDEQVVIESHLQACVSCRLGASELAEIGHALRDVPAPATASPHEPGRITSIILERVRLEQQLSFGGQLRHLFGDMHLVWAGLGATVAVVICVYASAGVLHAASRERPDSLAGLIDYLANPGSNANPVRLNDNMSVPRAFLAADPSVFPIEDAELAVAAVVTREGRVQNLELVDEQAGALQVKPDVILAMLDAAARARFEPARAGGSPVAVSMVWVLSTTTVKGRPDYDLYLLRPPRLQRANLSGPAEPPKPRSVPAPAAPVKVSPTGDLGISAG
jgi:putative zinc finger protein